MAKRLADWRKLRGLTQSELAEMVGVTTSAVGNWEAGLRVPRLRTAHKVADALGCDISDIDFAGEQPRERANTA